MNNKPRLALESSNKGHPLTFILRLWLSEGGIRSEWRASLEIPETRERIGFSSLELLFSYLMDLCEGIYNLKGCEVKR